MTLLSTRTPDMPLSPGERQDLVGRQPGRRAPAEPVDDPPAATGTPADLADPDRAPDDIELDLGLRL